MRAVRGLALVALAAGATACHSLRDDAVPPCPFCGDPSMVRLADGHEIVVPRWRIASLPAAAESDAAANAR